MKHFFEHYLWSAPFGLFLLGYLITGALFNVSLIKTPSITGLTLENAVKILASNNLNLRIISEKDDKFLQEGTIISQTPTSGSNIRPNQSIFVIITKKPNLTCPNLISLHEKEVAARLSTPNIKPKIHYISANYPPMMVFGQNPENGDIIENLQNPVITLYIAKKDKKMGILPSLKGKSTSEITQFLIENGLSYKVFHNRNIAISESHDCTQCQVLDQRPLAGSLINLEKPSQIYLIVA